MIGRRAAIGLCMLCALAFSAIVVQGAAAKGTVTFTCKKKVLEGGAGFSKAHCKKEDAVATGAQYEDIEVPKEEQTLFSTSNVTTGEVRSPVVLKGTVAGLEYEVSCTTLQGSGTAVNTEVGGERVVSGTDTITLSGCTVPKPAAQGCVIKGGEVKSNELLESSTGQPAPEEESNSAMFVTVEPVKAGPLLTVTLENCKTTALDTEYPTTGSVKLRPDGATTTSTHAEVTAQGTLKFMGQKSGLQISVTMIAKKEKGEEPNSPISITTH